MECAPTGQSARKKEPAYPLDAYPIVKGKCAETTDVEGFAVFAIPVQPVLTTSLAGPVRQTVPERPAGMTAAVEAVGTALSEVPARPTDSANAHRIAREKSVGTTDVEGFAERALEASFAPRWAPVRIAYPTVSESSAETMDVAEYVGSVRTD